MGVQDVADKIDRLHDQAHEAALAAHNVDYPDARILTIVDDGGAGGGAAAFTITYSDGTKTVLTYNKKTGEYLGQSVVLGPMAGPPGQRLPPLKVPAIVDDADIDLDDLPDWMWPGRGIPPEPLLPEIDLDYDAILGSAP